MPTVYYIDSAAVEPEAVECETAGYPNKDAKGRTMFHNTHYSDVEKAWEWLRNDCEIQLRWAAADVENARKREAEAVVKAANAAVRWEQIRRATKP